MGPRDGLAEAGVRMTTEELVRESTAYHGIPEHVEDPEVLAKVAALTAEPEEVSPLELIALEESA